MIVYKDHPVFDTYSYVVGVDPGSVTGVSIFDRFGLHDTSYHVALDSNLGMEKRNIGMAYSVINSVIVSLGEGCCTDKGSDLLPHIKVMFVIENNHVYSMKRSGAAMTQREMIGVMAAYAHKYGFDVIRISPAEAKKALTGSGGKEIKKPQMVAAARLEFPGIMEELSSNPKREAVADSIGIAMAGMVKWEKEACDG